MTFVLLLLAVSVNAVAVAYFLWLYVWNRSLSYFNDDEKALDELVRELRVARNTFYLVGGNPNNDVYAREEFRRALEDVKRRRPALNIEAIFPGTTDIENSPIADLARKLHFSVYASRKALPVHFRVVDVDSSRAKVYIEEHVDGDHRHIHLMRGAQWSASKMAARFLDIKKQAHAIVAA